MGDMRSGEDGTNVHGLFGAIIVEKLQSSWFDPVSDEEIESGLFADIYNPTEPSFREYAVFFHDELEIKNKGGEQPVDPHTGLPNGTTGISYRSGSLRWDVESGMWGIFRVMSRSIRYRCECICRNIGHWWEEQWYDKYM